MILADNKISRQRMAERLNVSKKTVERQLKKMPYIKYSGHGYSGHWIVDEFKNN